MDTQPIIQVSHSSIPSQHLVPAASCPPTPDLSRDDTLLPHRLRESTFRYYEPIIARAIAASPQALVFNAAPLRPITAAARIRDAMLALSRFRFTTTIDMALFDDLYAKKQLQVSHSEHSVVIGPKQRRGRTPSFASVTSTPRGHELLFAAGVWDQDDLRAVCRLISRRLISGPVRVEPTLADETVDLLTSTYDIAITQKPDHTLIF